MSSEQAGTSGRTEKWDFLKAEKGPSSALYYYAPLNDKTAFKPGWNTRRNQAAIQQDVERKAFDAYKEQRNAACGAVRKERLHDALDKNRFNPISHEAHAPDGTWRPATDPWQHQRVGIVAQEPRVAATETLRLQADTTRRNVGITEMRKERIAHGGLSSHPGGTMKEVLTWASGH